MSAADDLAVQVDDAVRAVAGVVDLHMAGGLLRAGSSGARSAVRVDADGAIVHVDVSIATERGTPTPDVARRAVAAVRATVAVAHPGFESTVDVRIASIDEPLEAAAPTG